MSVYKEIEIDLEDFADEELIEELSARGIDGFADPYDSKKLLNMIYEARRLGDNYQEMLDQYIYMTLGKIL